MRLFQATSVGVDEFDVPPPFLRYNTMENIKQMSSYSVYRDSNVRLPTPEKVAIMELSNSYERRRLGRQQQMLLDINQRCREQEITDLSSTLSNKCNLNTLEARKSPGRELTFYTTNFMPKRQNTKQNLFDSNELNLGASLESRSTLKSHKSGNSPRGSHDRSYKHFPVRRVIKHPAKSFTEYRSPTQTFTPRINLGPSPPTTITTHPDLFTRATLSNSQQIQMDHFLNGKDSSVVPLVLPSIDGGNSQKLDSLSTTRLHLGARTKTTHGLESTQSSRSSKSTFTVKPLGKQLNSDQIMPLVVRLTNAENNSPQDTDRRSEKVQDVDLNNN